MAVFNEIERYFERNADLHVLFIFDNMQRIEVELSDSSVTPWDEHPEYIFKVFDGQWFTAKYNIYGEWKEKRVVLLFPLISYKLCEMGNPLWLSLNNVFWGIFLFLLGRLWHECLDQYERLPMMLLSVAMIIVFVVLNIWDIGEYTMSGNLWTGYYPATLLKTLCALCGFSGFFLLLPTPRVPVLGYIGEHSMVFFVAHYPLLTFYQMLRSTFVRTLRGHWDDMIILTLLTFVFCFWIVPFVERIPWLSGRFRTTPEKASA